MNCILAITMIIACAIGSSSAQNNGTNWAGRIASKQRRPLISLINPHVDTQKILIIDGKRFENVRGEEKFYIPIPNANAIVFIVDHKDHSISYHIFWMDRDEDIVIRGKGSLFGYTIGSKNSTDTVSRTDDGVIVLCNTDNNAKSTLPELAGLKSIKAFYYLNLFTKSGESKTCYYSKDGKLLYEHRGPL